MAIERITETDDVLTLEVNNGDLNALSEIQGKWKFKDKESVLRFALAVLSLSSNEGVSIKSKDGNYTILQPGDDLVIR
jgi:hypothetical protein